jgi:hypothetical protein
MGQFYKGSVTVWINVPDDCETPPAELIDRIQFMGALLANAKGFGMFPEPAAHVEPATVEDWATVAKTEAGKVATDPDDAERLNALIDDGVKVVNSQTTTGQPTYSV